MKRAGLRGGDAVKLRHYGEDRLVERLCRRFPNGKGVIFGIGDDCAVLGRKSDPVWTLLKADALVEGIHFLDTSDPEGVGWKAMARAVSDIAAMGGLPRHALVTVAVSPDATVRKIEGIYSGIRRCCKTYGISLVGGETSRSPGPLFLNVSLSGEVEKKHCVLRSGARAGDLLYVTGKLGGSFSGKHLDFKPRLEEARWLVKNFKVRAMMDLSDGLGSDLPRLAKASQLGFELGEIPCTPGCSRKEALVHGEDYELLFALSAGEAARLEARWPKRFPKLPLTCIGSLLKKKGAAQIPAGHDHFK